MTDLTQILRYVTACLVLLLLSACMGYPMFQNRYDGLRHLYIYQLGKSEVLGHTEAGNDGSCEYLSDRLRGATVGSTYAYACGTGAKDRHLVVTARTKFKFEDSPEPRKLKFRSLAVCQEFLSQEFIKKWGNDEACKFLSGD